MIHLVSVQIGMWDSYFYSIRYAGSSICVPYSITFFIQDHNVSISSYVFVVVNILSHKTSLRHHNLLISLRILSRYLYIDDLVYVNSQIFVRPYTHRPASLPPIRYSLTLMYYHIDREAQLNLISRFNKNINKVINITYQVKLDMYSQRCFKFAVGLIKIFLIQL